MAHGHRNTRHRLGAPHGRLPASGTRVSFVLSAALHALLLLLIGMTGVKQAGERIELTEVAYIEERYGADVAKKVTIAPEKMEAARQRQKPKLEGSIFAKAKPPERPRTMPGPLMGAAMAPLPKTRTPAPAPAPATKLASRSRQDVPSLAPRVRAEDVLLAGNLENAPARRARSEAVDLQGKVLVGRTDHAAAPLPFAVETDDGALAGSALTLAVPEGGVEGGHPELVGGTLAAGKEAYHGALPAGNLVAREGDNGKLTALASVAIAGPGGGGGDGLATAGAAAEPTRGRGLDSRGGSDAVTRSGSLTPRRAADGPATAIQKTIAAPEAAREEEVAVAASSQDEEKGVSMSLSGPILDREILCSEAPAYPEEARRRAWQGTVSVYFTVRADGTVAKVVIEQASAHRVLDEAARRCVRQWRFSPLPGAAEQWGILTIVFRLR